MQDFDGGPVWLLVVWLIALGTFAALRWLPVRRERGRLDEAIIWVGLAAPFCALIGTAPFQVAIVLQILLIAFAAGRWIRRRTNNADAGPAV